MAHNSNTIILKKKGTMPDEKVVWSEEIIMSCNILCGWTKKKGVVFLPFLA